MCSIVAHSLGIERTTTSSSSSRHLPSRSKVLWFLVAASFCTNMRRVAVLAGHSSAKRHCRSGSHRFLYEHSCDRLTRRDCRGFSRVAFLTARSCTKSSRRRHFGAASRCNNRQSAAALEASEESNRQSANPNQHDTRVSMDLNYLNWRSFSDQLSESIHVPSISVPSQHVHWLLSNTASPIKNYLATQMPELEGIHPRIKVVVDDEPAANSNNNTLHHGHTSRKRILLMGSTITNNNDTLANNCSDRDELFSKLRHSLPHIPTTNIQQLIDQFHALPAPYETVHIPYQNQPIARILAKLLPPEAQPPPSSYEQIGHVAHFNLRPIHIPYGKLIGSVLLDRYHPTLRTVVNKRGEVGGPYRTYAVDLLAGDDDYSVQLVEHGTSLRFDLTKVYWCTRLEGERTYMIHHEFRSNQRIADAFCGVGALCIRAALEKGCRVAANDLNPDAVAYCEESATMNGLDVTERDVFSVQCGDAREFIMNLGMSSTEKDSSSSKAGAASVSNLPHHLMMNFPLDSPSFLSALRWWPSGEKMAFHPRVHVYTFARGDDVRTPAEVAIDMVADGLLPEGGYIEPSKFRGEYLDSLGCNVTAREIRDASPGKVVICVSFSVTRILLRRMQGDYSLF